MENIEIFLVEFKDVNGKYYYLRIKSESGEFGVESSIENELRYGKDSTFIKVYTDTDCRFEYNIRRNAIIGYKVIHDLTAG